MTYDALRKGRRSLPGYAYLVTVVTHQRQPVFQQFVPARLVIREMRRLHLDRFIESFAWVLMPDHLHWLFQLNEIASLSTVMKTFKARSAHVVNHYLVRQGALWQRAFYDRAVRENEDLRSIARYIVANPLRAGLVSDAGQYPHWDAVWL